MPSFEGVTERRLGGKNNVKNVFTFFASKHVFEAFAWEAMVSWIELWHVVFAHSGSTPAMSNVFPLRYKVKGKI